MLSCLPQGTYFHLGCWTKDRALRFILFGLSNFSGLAHEKKRVVLEFQVGLHNTGLHTLGLLSTFIQKYKLGSKDLDPTWYGCVLSFYPPNKEQERKLPDPWGC